MPEPAAAVSAPVSARPQNGATPNDSSTVQIAQSTADQQQTPPKKKDSHKHKRTPGLQLFDVFLYPFLTNFVVMGLSIAATYLTSKGGAKDAHGKLIYGKVGEWFSKRGVWMDTKFQAVGMSKSQAEMSRMVFFSFADGTLVAPLVKLFEDRRTKIAHWIDKMMGTAPGEESSYAQEPKQSWLSVVGGRLATVAVVVPTAVALSKIKYKGHNINDLLFSNPGKAVGEWVAKKPDLARHFGKLDVPELFKVGAFEAFYTSVCTATLYVFSRFFAYSLGEYGKESITADASVAAPTEKTASNHSTPSSPTANTAPNALVFDTQHIDRVAADSALRQAST